MIVVNKYFVLVVSYFDIFVFYFDLYQFCWLFQIRPSSCGNWHVTKLNMESHRSVFTVIPILSPTSFYPAMVTTPFPAPGTKPSGSGTWQQENRQGDLRITQRFEEIEYFLEFLIFLPNSKKIFFFYWCETSCIVWRNPGKTSGCGWLIIDPSRTWLVCREELTGVDILLLFYGSVELPFIISVAK